MTSWLPQFLSHWGYLAVALMMALECFVPLFPAEVVIPLATLMATRGQLSIPGVLIAGVIGTLSGTSIWYGTARALGRDRFDALVTRYGRFATLSTHEVGLVHRLFDRWGAALVCVGRLIPGVRAVISIPAGIAHMPLPRFLLWSALGVAMWIGTLVYAGWLVRGRYLQIEHYAGPAATIIIAAIALIWLYRILTWRTPAP